MNTFNLFVLFLRVRHDRRPFWFCVIDGDGAIFLSYSLSLFPSLFLFLFSPSLTHTHVQRRNGRFPVIRIIKKGIPIITVSEKTSESSLFRVPFLSLYLFGFFSTSFFRASSPVDDRSPCGSDVTRCETRRTAKLRRTRAAISDLQNC